MRDFSALNSAMSAQYAMEPLLILSIHWDTEVTDRFSTKIPTGKDVYPYVQDFGQLTMQLSAKVFAQLQTAAITLNDTEGLLKTRNDTYVAEGKVCRIYFTYEGVEDEVEILRGVIEQPVWQEGGRTFSFNLVTREDKDQVGVILDDPLLDSLEVLIPNLDRRAIQNKMVPIHLGCVSNQPTIRMTRQFEAMLAEDVVINNPHVASPEIEDSTEVKLQASKDDEPLFFGFDLDEIAAIEIEGHVINIGTPDDGVDGVFTFDITNNNPIKYGIITTGERILDDPDYDNPKVLWLATDGWILEGQSCAIAQTDSFNVCERQEGRKCWFVQPWTTRETYTGPIPGGGVDTIETRRKLIIEGSNQIIQVQTWKPAADFSIYNEFFNEDKVVLRRGSRVRIWFYAQPRGYLPDYYLVNEKDITLTSVKAKRSRSGRYEELPYVSATGFFYSIETLSVSGHAFKVLKVKTPLDLLPNAEYSEELYVSARSITGLTELDGSTAPTDPWGNTAELLKYLIQTYGSEYAIDSTSFNSVKSAVTNYPMAVSLYNQTTLFSLIADLAWQARVAIRLDGSTFKLKYLSVTPSVDDTIDSSEILARSMIQSNKSVLDIVTVFTYTYRVDGTLPVETASIFTNYLEYGRKEGQFNFWAYNRKECVEVSAKFWANRYGKLWQRVTVTLPVEKLNLELFDCLGLDLTNPILVPLFKITGIVLKSEVLAADYTPTTQSVNASVEIPVVVASDSVDSTYWTITGLATRPEHACAVDKKGYFPIFFPEKIKAHKLQQHSDVNTNRRRREFGDDETNTALETGDVLVYDAAEKEFIPANILDLIEAEGGVTLPEPVEDPVPIQLPGITNRFYT